MLQVLLLSLVTTGYAFTTHRYDVYESTNNYQPSAPSMDKIFTYGNGNERKTVQMYEYPKRYDGVLLSDVFNQGPVINSDSDHRRVDTQYNYQNPYQWSNIQVPWNRVAVTEPIKFYKRGESSNQDRRYDNVNTDTENRQSVVKQDKTQVIIQMKGINESNNIQGNLNVPQISTQSDDVNRTLVINELQLQITWNNDHQNSSEDNGNISTRSINYDNYTNSLNFDLNSVPSKQTPDKTYRPTKTINRTGNNTKINAFKVNTNNKDKNRPNNTVNGIDKNRNANNNSRYGTKTTQDNKVTPRTHEQRIEKDFEHDRWIWSDGEDQKVETTTLFDLGDRAAFAADGCPSGKVKLGKTCVAID